MKLSAIVILNCLSREREGKFLQKQLSTIASKFNIPVYISFDDGTMGVWKNFKQALTMKVGEGTHRMVIHDDMAFDRNILEKILHIMEYAPQDCPIAFYNPTNGGYKECEEKGHHVLKTSTNVWLPATIYPESFIPDFLDFNTEHIKEKAPEDDRFVAYLQHAKKSIYAVVPSLTQHLGAFRSNFSQGGITPSGVPRYSTNYDTQFDVKSVDWEKEFADPYTDKMNVNFIKKVVKDEFLKNGGKF